MPFYVIVPGDSLSKIAARCGLTWRTLFNLKENQSFRESHQDPDLIKPGEVIWIPDSETFRDGEVLDQAWVTRSSSTESHLNTIRSSYSIYLEILFPVEDCLSSPDRFTLYSDDRCYSKTLSLKDNVVEINGDAFLIFDKVLADRKYTLTVECLDEKPKTLFDRIDYSQLPFLRRRSAFHADDSATGNRKSFSDYSFEPLFTPQLINVMGEGPYHVNRFRIYFRACRWVLTSGRVPLEKLPRRTVLPVARVTHGSLVREFIRDFPVLFNGGKEGILTNGIKSVTWMDRNDRKVWKHNMALVVRHEFRSREHANATVLGFEIDIQPLRVVLRKWQRSCLKVALEGGVRGTVGPLEQFVDPIIEKIVDDAIPIEMPEHPGTDPTGSILGFRPELTNAHTDWVGIDMLDENCGFAVQTLWRHERDWASQRLLDLIDNAALPENVKRFARTKEEEMIELFNQFHFLAGRRSWVICRADNPSARNYISAPAEAMYFLETAAIERYSQAIHNELTSEDPGFFVEFREAVKTVWIRLLMNYITASGFDAISLDVEKGQWDKEADVSYRELSFNSQKEAEEHAMTKEVIKLHPTLGSQLHD